MLTITGTPITSPRGDTASGSSRSFIIHREPAKLIRSSRNPVANVAQAVKELRDKFDHYVIGPSSVADDRIQEEGGNEPMELLQILPFGSHYL